MKKTYTKPEAEFVSFYSEEEIANVSAEDETISGDMNSVSFYDLGFDWS